MSDPAVVFTDREVLIAELGGLLTVPAFAELTPSLGAVSEQALGLTEPARIERGRNAIRAMIAKSVAQLSSPDRMPNPFTDLLVTAFGSAVARCDFLDDPVRDAELLIDAALASGAVAPAIETLSGAVLGLMNEMAARSGWLLYEPQPDEVPDLPDEKELAALAERVCLDEAALQRVCGDSWQRTLAPLIYDGDSSQARARPLFPCASGGVVVMRPEALAGALAFVLANDAYERHGGEALDESFSVLAAHRTLAGFAELGLRRFRPAPDLQADFSHSSSLVFLDTDAVVHLMVLTVDLELGVPPRGTFWQPTMAANIPAHLDAVEREVRAEAEHLETVVHLVVLEGAGAQPLLQIARRPDLASPHIALTGSELQWLARHPDVTPRDLAAFAHDLTDLRRRVNYVSSSQLDDFEVWRSDDLGFTAFEASAGDGSQDLILAAGFARNLRQEVVDRFAPRTAPAPASDGEWRVARWLEYRDVELWRPWGSAEWPPHFFVPGLGPGIWVLDVDFDVPSDEEDLAWDAHRKHTELVAYWLWRLGDQLPRLREAAARRVAPLQVRLTIELASEELTERVPPDGQAFEIESTADGADVIVHPAALDELGGQTAAPEHAYIQRVLDVLSASLGVAVPETPEFPAGLRKLVYLTGRNPAIAPVAAMDGRVHRAYRTRAHRLVGTQLLGEGFELGLIPEPKLNDVFHTATNVLQADLERQLDDLDAHQTRMLAMNMYEGLVHRRVIADVELVAIDEFFGHDEAAAEQRLEEYRALSLASVACRYVIESVAASPGSGSRLVSDHALQSLLAAATSIIDFGRMSDAVHFGLTRQAAAALIPPGLLMMTSPDFRDAHDRFTSSVRLGDIERSAEQRASMLEAEARSGELDEIARRISDAHLAEYGCTIEDVGNVLNALIQVPTNPSRVTRLSEDEIHGLAEKALDDARRAAAVIARLSLGPRDHFFQPPAPYTPRDVFPWRFNRELSYVRRPLVHVCEDGDEHYVFGPGACFGAGEMLDDLTRTARLGQEGSALRAASIELQQTLSRAFEASVADAFDADPGWLARRRVNKVGRRRIQRPSGQDLGDIDVLAVCPALKLIVCAEAKALAGAFAPHQLRRELDANFSSGAKKASAAMKLVERAAFVAANQGEFLRAFGINDAAQWCVGAFMVTDYENLSALIEECPVPVITLRQLRVQVADGTLHSLFR